MSGLTQPTDTSPKYADAVLEGGGVRGIGHVGALAVAEQLGYQWVNIAGTSAGAIVAALMAAGYRATEMFDIMSNVDFKRFADSRGFNWFFAKPAFNMLIRGGIHPGKYVEDFVREQLLVKGIQKFGDLLIKGQEDNPNPYARYRLTVIASDISSGRMLRLPYDAQIYGLNPDDVDVARAVRMSAGCPLFYIPIDQQGPDGSIYRIVDGGLLSNFPIFIFDVVDREPTRPTFGFRLVDQLPNDPNDYPLLANSTNNTFEIIQAMINTMMMAHDRLYMDDHTYVRTIAIPVDGIGVTRFNLRKDEAQKLYQNGKAAAEKFFATWDFEAYKAAYRRGNPPPSRQERLHADMKSVQRGS